MSSRNSMFEINRNTFDGPLSPAIMSKKEPLYVRPKLQVRFPSVVTRENRTIKEAPNLAS